MWVIFDMVGCGSSLFEWVSWSWVSVNDPLRAVLLDVQDDSIMSVPGMQQDISSQSLTTSRR